MLKKYCWQIRDWCKGKERNIRALLGSLHEVLWSDANSKWTAVSMANLLTAADVKKYYRKACLVVHPDKVTHTIQHTLHHSFLNLTSRLLAHFCGHHLKCHCFVAISTHNLSIRFSYFRMDEREAFRGLGVCATRWDSKKRQSDCKHPNLSFILFKFIPLLSF